MAESVLGRMVLGVANSLPVRSDQPSYRHPNSQDETDTAERWSEPQGGLVDPCEESLPSPRLGMEAGQGRFINDECPSRIGEGQANASAMAPPELLPTMTAPV